MHQNLSISIVWAFVSNNLLSRAALGEIMDVCRLGSAILPGRDELWSIYYQLETLTSVMIQHDIVVFNFQRYWTIINRVRQTAVWVVITCKSTRNHRLSAQSLTFQTKRRHADSAGELWVGTTGTTGVSVSLWLRVWLRLSLWLLLFRLSLWLLLRLSLWLRFDYD